MDKELLLGYLLNALDARETARVERELERNPPLHSELAALQQEISPLDYIADSVEPPPGLASRTCANIWAALDNTTLDNDSTLGDKGEYIAPNSSIFLDSVYFSPESILPPSFLLQDSEPEKVEDKFSRVEAKHIEIEEVPPYSSRLGLIASMSVGILIAIFLFPMIQYAKWTTRSYVEESWTNEIGRRVDQYEWINQGNTPDAEMQPINLALYGWQELHSEVLAASPGKQGITRLETEAAESPPPNEVFRGQEPSLYFRNSNILNGLNEPISLDMSGLSDYILFVLPGWKSLEWDISIRSAFGQNILFKDGRIFLRMFPAETTLRAY